MKDPEKKTAASGNVYIAFPVVVDNAIGCVTWWNLKIMESLFSKLYEGLLEKHRYAKFVGIGGPREYTKKDGKSGTSYDMLVTGVEMQNGEFIQAEKPEPGSEG